MGYGLVVCASRIVGSNTSAWSQEYSAYLGPNSQTTFEEREKATKIAEILIEKKGFEIPKDSVLKVIYRAPGLFSRGHVIFHTAPGDTKLIISDLQEGGTPRTLRGLLPSLVAFAPDRFYDEKTGELVGTIIAKTGKFPK